MDHVRLFYTADGFARFPSAPSGRAADGDVKVKVKVQVDLAGTGDWTGLATLLDTGTTLKAGEQGIRIMLDATQLQVHT